MQPKALRDDISHTFMAKFKHDGVADVQGIVVSQEVQAALREGRAVVALESTIIRQSPLPSPRHFPRPAILRRSEHICMHAVLPA